MTVPKLSGERGSVGVQALLLLGLFLLIFALVVEIGALRTRQLRLQAVFDRAALAGVGAIDGAELAAAGRLVLDRSAAEARTRRYLELNLAPLEGQLVGQNAAQAARSALVGVVISGPDQGTVTLSGRLNLAVGYLGLAGIESPKSFQFRATARLKGH